MRRGNIYLAGFMGTGKSVVGKALARRLGARFVDLDSEIARLARKSVSDIFKTQGEPAFRRLESRLVSQVSRKNGQVVALGGGALLNPGNRACLERSGIIVRLTCAEPELWRRLKGQLPSRPLLHGAAPAARFRGLLMKRRNAYEAAVIKVSTTNKTPLQAAKEIERRLLDGDHELGKR